MACGGLLNEQYPLIGHGVKEARISAESILLTKIQLTLSLEAIMCHIGEQQVEHRLAGEGQQVSQETRFRQGLFDQVKGRIPCEDPAAFAQQNNQ